MISCQLQRPRSAHKRAVITDTLMIHVKLDRAVIRTKFKNNLRSMARAEKRFKIIIMGHRDSLSYLILSWFGCLRGTLIYWLSPKF